MYVCENCGYDSGEYDPDDTGAGGCENCGNARYLYSYDDDGDLWDMSCE